MGGEVQRRSLHAHTCARSLTQRHVKKNLGTSKHHQGKHEGMRFNPQPFGVGNRESLYHRESPLPPRIFGINKWLFLRDH
ncbi:hypothetical protein I79_000046 [Cricetulus griseus]|uniref:Uncharacterized protein n=1 Tax=Cricetulus griseus TaxID=10029 RepID=G3GRA3_CRIGR|nr:hypothetical protein I79_000046 [Cricetulus griseus]